MLAKLDLKKKVREPTSGAWRQRARRGKLDEVLKNTPPMKKPNWLELGQVIEKYVRDGVIRTLDP
jgi:hypothetical protein